jgi:uncharacterized protein YkwD
MRRLRILLPTLTISMMLLSLPATSSAATCTGADLSPSAANGGQVREATLCLLNEQRRHHGLPVLRQQPSLAQAAGKYARLMVAQGFFDHVSPGGSTMASRIKQTKYLDNTSGWSLGENIAWGSSERSTPSQIVDAWMHSAGHRRNILDRSFREIGIGVALGAPQGGSGATYVNDFGSRG